MRVSPTIKLTTEERTQLESYKRSGKTSARLRERSAMILLADSGLNNQQIGARLRQDIGKVGRWRKRYALQGMSGILKDKTRPSGRAPISKVKCSQIIRLTLETSPAGATHWSRASMSQRSGVSPSSVGRIWSLNGLKPHRIKTFKLSNDPHFEEKLEDIVGLYLSPPERAIVLSCDEKSQIQALDRTQPGLPLKTGRYQTITHDYKRHGTTSLFAALNIANGKVIGTCMKKHRHQEWIRFLELIDENTPKSKEIHLICDNYCTHKHRKVKTWQKKHPRFHFHFTPTSASWLNMVERFFRDLTVNRLRRGVFRSTEELTRAIDLYLENHNTNPKPFIWTAKASDILEKVKRGRERLNKQSV